MKNIDDIVMFIPACGFGERVKARGQKPFIHLNDPGTLAGKASMALNRVMEQAPDWMDVEIAIRRDMGTSPLGRSATVHFMEETTGQANTIYHWLRRTRVRNYALISNCDNAIDRASIEDGIQCLGDRIRGVIYVFQPPVKGDTRWSYVSLDSKHQVLEIEEHKPISPYAVAGVYLVNMFALRMSLFPEDIYLSQALERMDGLYAKKAKHYEGWNDLAQLAELESGTNQYL